MCILQPVNLLGKKSFPQYVSLPNLQFRVLDNLMVKLHSYTDIQSPI